MRLPSRTMETTIAAPSRALTFLVGALVLSLILVLAPTAASAADGTDAGDGVVLAAEERERRPIAPTQRDQLALLLYGLMGLAVVVGGATMRRQLKGERPQTDGEFRWR